MFSVSKRPTIHEIHSLYRTRKALPSQVIQFFLKRIEKDDAHINAFVYLTHELTSVQAQTCDDMMLTHPSYHTSDWENAFDVLTEKYPLFGIPYGIKAIIQIEGQVFNACSRILDNFISPYNSTVYTRIADAGAIVLGIHTMDEFAMGASGETCAYGIIRNPFDPERVPGGSSAGSAAAVAAGFTVFSLGTDTGGSIRQPACFTDTVGLKPTYGLVPRWGVIPMASSFDQVGAFTNSVEDNIIVTHILAGKDECDQTTIESEDMRHRIISLYKKKSNIQLREKKTILKSSKPLKIGIPQEFYPQDSDSFDPRIKALLIEVQKKLQSLGHELIPISLPMAQYAVSVYYMLMSVEVASNLERHDGIRYAKQVDGSYKHLFYDHRSQFFGSEAQRRIMLGTYASSAGYADEYYNQALKVREIARTEFVKAFERCDVLFAPTSPELPFPIGKKSDDPLTMYLSDIFTCGINPVRLPALNVPIGFVEEGGKKLPTGCQLIGKELHEDILFELALEIEILQKPLRMM